MHTTKEKKTSRRHQGKREGEEEKTIIHSRKRIDSIDGMDGHGSTSYLHWPLFCPFHHPCLLFNISIADIWTRSDLLAPEAAAEPSSTAPLLVDLIPSIVAPRSTSSLPASPLPPSRSNSISLPIPTDEPLASVRTSARSTSLGQLLALPLLNSSLDYRPRALSIAATAVSSTSTGAQLSVSMSSSPDKSRLDIHHNSLALSHDMHASSLLAGDLKLDREWDDPYFTYLAPIAASLLTCHGDHFFDMVCEELAINLGVKYAFISQLVSLDELKELDPTEYMNLIEQFGGLVPPIDGVMHNISSWPGE